MQCKTNEPWTQRLIYALYEKTRLAQSNRLNTIFLTAPAFYKPGVDRDLLLNWPKELAITDERNFPKNLNTALVSCISSGVEDIPNFDFSKIQSFSHSKGFGKSWCPHINGSWFKDAAAWGRAMYPSDNLSGLDEKDWYDNIYHIEQEGFSANRPLNVEYYAWLDRYLCVQTGVVHITRQCYCTK